MHPHPLDGAYVKLQRAQRHLSELIAASQRFLRPKPFQALRQDDPGTDSLTYVIKMTAEVPKEWGGIIGDVVHNARASLDYLAWQLVLKNGGAPGINTY